MIFKFTHLKAGDHVHVRVFSGDNDTSLGLNGHLVFRKEQFKELVERSASDDARPIFVEHT